MAHLAMTGNSQYLKNKREGKTLMMPSNYKMTGSWFYIAPGSNGWYNTPPAIKYRAVMLPLLQYLQHTR